MQEPTPTERMPLTRTLAAFAADDGFGPLPERVRGEALRAFVNFVGCAVGGCREPAVLAAIGAADAGRAGLIGHADRTDAANASFVNALASAVHAFDDTHLATVTHPTGPVAAALLAAATEVPTTGAEFLSALAVGIEIQCRLSNALLLPPARANLDLYVTGITGPVGAAAAVGRSLGLDRGRIAAAMGLAALQAGGFRASHGAMAGAFPPAHAARAGLTAARLARAGFECPTGLLEADRGFLAVFGPGADPSHALAGLGERYELLANAYKPYPCGIVVHPTIDACLAIADRLPPDHPRIASVRLRVHPLAASLADRPAPRDGWAAVVSLQHWAAAALVRRAAGIAEGRQACVDDPAVAALRTQITLDVDPTLDREGAAATVVLADGTVHEETVPRARGSLARPMTDDELDAKFRRQAAPVLGTDGADRLLGLCRAIDTLPDVGAVMAATVTPPP